MKKKSKRKIEFENSLLLRNFEIDLHWKRSWFFGALFIAIASGYLNIQQTENGKFNNFINYKICLSFLLMAISICQSLMNRGSKYWQERWEFKTKNRESKLKVYVTKEKVFQTTDEKINEREFIDLSINDKKENYLTKAHRFSVSKLTFLIWDLIAITCIIIWLKDIFEILTLNCLKIDWQLTIIIFLFHYLMIAYVSNFINGGKIDEEYSSKYRNKIKSNDYLNGKLKETDENE